MGLVAFGGLFQLSQELLLIQFKQLMCLVLGINYLIKTLAPLVNISFWFAFVYCNVQI